MSGPSFNSFLNWGSEKSEITGVVHMHHFWVQELLQNRHAFPYMHIYYSVWADQRRRMVSYKAYRPLTQQYTRCSCDCREYIAEPGLYISTAGSILLSQECIFGWVNVYSSWQLTFKKLFWVLQWRGQFSPGLTKLLPVLHGAPVLWILSFIRAAVVLTLCGNHARLDCFPWASHYPDGCRR